MSEPHDPITITMFGELRIRVNNLPIPRLSAKAQELFALLVIWNELPVSRKRLASTLWPARKSNALGLLRTTLMELRKALGHAAARLPSEDRTTLRLDLTGAIVDVFEFDRAVKSGSRDAIQTAAALYKQDLLVGWEAAWVQPERERRALDLARLRRDIRGSALGVTTPRGEHNHDEESTLLARDVLSVARNTNAISEIRGMLAQNYAVLQRLECMFDDIDTVDLAVDNLSRAEALYTVGVSNYLEGDIDGAMVCQQQALQIAERLNDASGTSTQARVLDQLGRLSMNDDKDAARRYFERAYEIRIESYRTIRRLLVTSLLGLGDATSNFSQAMDYYARALSMAEENNDIGGVAWSHFTLAIATLYRGEWDISLLARTLAHLSNALQGFVTTEDPTGLFAVLEGLARACHLVENSTGAARMLEIEAILRHKYSAPQTVKNTNEAARSLSTVRPEATETAAKVLEGAELDWTRAVAEADRIIRELSLFTHVSEL